VTNGFSQLDHCIFGSALFVDLVQIFLQLLE